VFAFTPPLKCACVFFVFSQALAGQEQDAVELHANYTAAWRTFGWMPETFGHDLSRVDQRDPGVANTAYLLPCLTAHTRAHTHTPPSHSFLTYRSQVKIPNTNPHFSLLSHSFLTPFSPLSHSCLSGYNLRPEHVESTYMLHTLTRRPEYLATAAKMQVRWGP
jgi:hypothetical protein